MNAPSRLIRAPAVAATPESLSVNIGQRWPLGVLAIVVAAVVLVRWRFLDTPLERDEGEFAYGGQLILAGETPYRAFYAMKLPGIYLVYAAIEAAFGQSARAIHQGLLLANVISLLLVARLGDRLFNLWTGVLASTALALFTLSPAVHGTQAQAEHFVVLFGLGGTLALLSAVERRSLFRYAVAGLCFGVALLIKQHGALLSLFAIVFAALDRPGRWKREPKRRFLELAMLGAAIAAPLAVACAVIASLGAWEPFVFWTSTYPRQYVTQVPLAVAWKLFAEESQIQTASNSTLWIAALAGLFIVCLSQDARPRRLFVLAWLSASIGAVLPGLMFRSHYYLFLFPPLALLAGVGVEQAARWAVHRGAGVRAGVLAMVAIVVVWPMIELGRNFAFTTPTDLVQKMYPNSPFEEMPEIAAFLAANTTPEDRVAVLGSEPELFFYADRRSATGHIYMYPLVERHGYALAMQEQLIREVEAAQPEFLVLVELFTSWLPQPGSPRRLHDWLASYLPAHYRVVGRAEFFDGQPTEFVWDSKKLRAPPRSPLGIAVFRRKPGR